MYNTGQPIGVSMPIPQKKPVNYLNNKDILKEIHKSKTSYCSYTKKEFHQYDGIIDTPDMPLEKSLAFTVKPTQIKEAKLMKSLRLSQEQGLTGQRKIDPKTIETDGLVFRVMTWEHIPMSQKQPRKVVKKKKAVEIIDFDDDKSSEDLFADLEDKKTKPLVDDMVHSKVNFPPFQHYLLDANTMTLTLVGKSHWKGGMKTGSFTATNGALTDKLARMYIMLCEKYAMKYNWRGYTYNDEMRNSAILQLTYVGLRFNEAKSANPFAYYTAAITNSFCRVLNTEKRNQNIRDDILEMNGLNPSFSRQMKDYNGLGYEKPVETYSE
jgi:hypothetical protein